MLPENSAVDTVAERKSDRAFEIDFENKRIGGIIEGKKALIQYIGIVLRTQRYRYPVFSHSFGVELENVMDEGYVVAMGRIKNAIYDALIHDGRILGVDGFEFEKHGSGMAVKFNVKSIFGDVKYETEVE